MLHWILFTSFLSYNVTEEILPFITYGFQVSVCNAIGCSTFTEMVTVTTEQDGNYDPNNLSSLQQTFLCSH